MTEEENRAREAIRRILHAYTIAVDKRDGEAFASLFAEDAILEFVGFDPVPAFSCEGRRGLQERAAAWSNIPGKDPSLALTSFIRHNLTSCEIELTGSDSASARTYFVVFTDIGADHVGVYNDEFVRQDEEWLIARRIVTLDWRSSDSLFPPIR